jgi:hypothetical protein
LDRHGHQETKDWLKHQLWLKSALTLCSRLAFVPDCSCRGPCKQRCIAVSPFTKGFGTGKLEPASALKLGLNSLSRADTTTTNLTYLRVFTSLRYDQHNSHTERQADTTCLLRRHAGARIGCQDEHLSDTGYGILLLSAMCVVYLELCADRSSFEQEISPIWPHCSYSLQRCEARAYVLPKEQRKTCERI